MPCPVCKTSIESEADHRNCVFSLFEQNKIKHASEWEAMAMKPVTVVKGRVRIRVKKDVQGETNGD